ncbi:tyrosine-type recombinase/integrase [Phycisphaerales bacterium AB-hyl4]|uniref:Tyrosine-type recombinase/integrase n=1 Tax=Natronomicrosphaera hydrolytica TaxID=3242702 RepID=A0ABV4U5L2_9BACT
MTAARTNTLPKLRRQKEKGRPDRAFVVLNGRKIACGRWGTPQAHQRYDRAIVEWLAGGRQLPIEVDQQVTVAILIDRFLAHAQEHYRRRDGSVTNEYGTYERAAWPLLALYADLAVQDFTPRCLRAVRQKMINAGWSRPHINSQIRRLRHVFRWGSAQELLPAPIHSALSNVEPLQQHRSNAPETDPVTPVSDAVVEATLPNLTPTLQAMVNLQRYTGMRPAELCELTTDMIDTSGDVWVANYDDHKTAHRGRRRMVFIRPQAQKVLAPWLHRDLAAPVFSPRQSERERLEAMRSQRKTPLTCGNGPGDNRVSKPRCAPADKWTTQSYGRAIQRACDEAFPPPEHLARRRVKGEGRKSERWETRGEWRGRLSQEGLLNELTPWQKAHRWAPNQLRHSYATRVRREHGLEAAQVLLGHAKADVTQVYAERDLQKALSVAREVG